MEYLTEFDKSVKKLVDKGYIHMTQRYRPKTIPFFMISVTGFNDLAELSTVARKFLVGVMDKRKRKKWVVNYECPLCASEKSRAYQQLKKAALLFRVKKNVYMINPLFLVPPGEELRGLVQEWNKLVSEDLRIELELKYLGN